MLIISIAVDSSVISCIWLRKIFKHMLDWLPSRSHGTWNSLSELGWTAAPASQEHMAKFALFPINLVGAGFQYPWWQKAQVLPPVQTLYGQGGAVSCVLSPSLRTRVGPSIVSVRPLSRARRVEVLCREDVS